VVSTPLRVKQWEIIADNLKKAGWSMRYVSAVDRERRTIWIADAQRDGKRYVVRPDELLTALELRSTPAGACRPGIAKSASLQAPDAQLSAPASRLPTPRARG
jgi:hypothetical protein